jgi:hypothetical protein
MTGPAEYEHDGNFPETLIADAETA